MIIITLDPAKNGFGLPQRGRGREIFERTLIQPLQSSVSSYAYAMGSSAVDFRLIQARLPVESEGSRPSGRYFTVCH